MKRIIIPFIAVIFLCCGCKTKEAIKVNSNISSEVKEEFKTDYVYEAYSTIKVIDFTDRIIGGKTASITIKGEANTLYGITVTYSSGQSKSKGLNEKSSDKYGYVTWNWRTTANCKEGSFPVEIIKNNKTVLKTYIKIIKSET